MKSKIVLFICSSAILLLFIGWMFWDQELKYALPTPVPTNFVNVKLGDEVKLGDYIDIPADKPLLLHFFNFDCPCSRFNMKELERLAKKNQDNVAFAVILQSSDTDDIQRFQDKYELDVQVVLDKDGMISDLCGVYATPQAVILDESSKIYFKGNYNKARFCTRKETKFVDLAIDHLLKGEKLPYLVEYAMPQPYGCTLPSDDSGQLADFKLFTF